VDRLRQIAQQRAISRRDFLRSAAMVGTTSRLLGFSPLRAATLSREVKMVVVTLGAGARDEETFAPEGQISSFMPLPIGGMRSKERVIQ
jgi:uncharacterized protein (DUF1501 family)